MLRLLHFSDAHIDIANYGRRDAETGLPVRVLDFLKSLDEIVDTAIAEKVDLVLFAGDAYKDRNPAPTFQREWGRRIMRLSRAGIPTLLLVGNHDLSPAAGRAHAIQEFDTLEVPHVHVISQPGFLGPQELGGLPLQVLALPWVSRSGLVASLNASLTDGQGLNAAITERLGELVAGWLEDADPALPVVLAAHATVTGAKYGTERSIQLGSDFILPGGLVRDPRIDYVALGHIHQKQDLNPDGHPHIVYPGSIERVDFGEAKEKKYFVIAHVGRGSSELDWRPLRHIRPFYDRWIELRDSEGITPQLLAALPSQKQLEGAIARLIVDYPRDWEPLIDEAAVRQHAAGALEFHFIRRPRSEARARLAGDGSIGSLTPLELLDLYWRTTRTEREEIPELQNLAEELIREVEP